MSIVEKAKEMKNGLEAGKVTLSQIVAWADQEIEQAENPLEEIVELSLVETENDAITWLSTLLNKHSAVIPR